MTIKMNHVVLTESEIKSLVKRLADEIRRDYVNRQPIMVPIMKGAIVFTADLLRELSDMKFDFDYVDVSSYAHGASTGDLQVEVNVKKDITGRDVILIDEIIDTGLTLDFLQAEFKKYGAKTVASVVAVDKKAGRKVDIEANYVGAIVPNEYLLGYGMDLDGNYRFLPQIIAIKN
ncbi:phosphoribosyltransferase [Periweissella beninensis]|uniref:Hypoxanthine-guanine phosphoribosyltransferase n=1 Tax=Periweissella beninensis TaxID=504936 RepID=A0ABT0VFG9_9LACO|nr:phosphoribosyltransferase family protein [Periweissella beninensis]MBM7543548.1 hypoxanthine phosphoribosyltransferase [Periweissella beninensis]MCM2436530.1 hypoxanthine phosphoribosyltransferase [Periweissella beninensis]MCT4396247.1 hypoxanthine phosphoribosyltransferase [Periweissella beninensis]